MDCPTSQARHPNPRLVYNMVIGKRTYALQDQVLKNGSAYQKKESQKFKTPTLFFESRFETGNLMRATQVGERAYDLQLQDDVNTNGNKQWFYFAVQGAIPGKQYYFRITNFTKSHSLYNHGMQPVLYSIKAKEEDGLGWHRGGTEVCYFENAVPRRKSKRNYFTLSFSHRFNHTQDTVYFAHAYPFTYTNLNEDLRDLCRDVERAKWVTRSELCRSVSDNAVDLLCITAPAPYSELKKRKSVVLSARVHPGETMASYIMKGVIEMLTGPSVQAAELRQRYKFYLVPMLNPDGVVNGNYRAGIMGRDMNRQWLAPSPDTEPSIYALKNLLRKCSHSGGVEMYCDFHGHSRKTNIFLYGCCSSARQQNPMAVLQQRLFPYLLSINSPVCSYEDCSFRMAKSKNSTGRVVAFSELWVDRSYTLEASFLGSSGGPQFHPGHLMDAGKEFCRTLLQFHHHHKVLKTALDGRSSGSLSDECSNEMDRTEGGSHSKTMVVDLLETLLGTPVNKAKAAKKKAKRQQRKRKGAASFLPSDKDAAKTSEQETLAEAPDAEPVAGFDKEEEVSFEEEGESLRDALMEMLEEDKLGSESGGSDSDPSGDEREEGDLLFLVDNGPNPDAAEENDKDSRSESEAWAELDKLLREDMIMRGELGVHGARDRRCTPEDPSQSRTVSTRKKGHSLKLRSDSTNSGRAGPSAGQLPSVEKVRNGLWLDSLRDRVRSGLPVRPRSSQAGHESGCRAQRLEPPTNWQFNEHRAPRGVASAMSNTMTQGHQVPREELWALGAGTGGLGQAGRPRATAKATQSVGALPFSQRAPRAPRPRGSEHAAPTMLSPEHGVIITNHFLPGNSDPPSRRA